MRFDLVGAADDALYVRAIAHRAGIDDDLVNALIRQSRKSMRPD